MRALTDPTPCRRTWFRHRQFLQQEREEGGRQRLPAALQILLGAARTALWRREEVIIDR